MTLDINPTVHAGKIGACTANALAAAVHFDKPSVAPSRLFIYYNERVIEGDVADDSGACLADGIKVLVLRAFFFCWPYCFSSPGATHLWRVRREGLPLSR